MTKRWRNTVLLAAIESTAGTEQSISASTDGIVCENLQIQFGDSAQGTNEYTGSLDGYDDVPIGGPCTITFSTYVKGSPTAGVATEIGKLLRACSWTETVTANAIPTAAATVAGTSSGELVAPAAFGGADDAYNGMPIILSSNPSTPSYALVRDFIDSSNVIKVSEIFSPVVSANTMLQIPVNVMYKPHSNSTVSSLTFHVYLDDVKHAIIGARGTFSLNMTSGRVMMFTWTFTGVLASAARTDTSNPTPTYPDIDVPKLTWRNDNANGAFTLDGVRIGVSSLTFDNGNTVSADANPNQPNGFDIAAITSRTMVATIDPKLASMSTRDTLTKLQDGTKVSVAAWVRRSSGNGFGILIPNAQVLATPYGNRDGRVTEQIRLKPTGINSGAYITYF